MKQRLINIDLIRIIGMVMVVLLHTAVNFTLRSDFFLTKLWFLLEPIIALSKTAVLLFFMVSGYLILTKERSVVANTKRTLQRLVLPLFFFTSIDTVINLFKYDFRIHGLIDFFTQELNRLMNEKSSPLWFLIVLVFLHLLNPLWYKVFAQQDKAKLAQYLTFGALLYSITMAIFEYPARKQGIFFTGATYWLGYIFFYLYGGLVKSTLLFAKKTGINLLLLLSGILLTVFGDFLTLYGQTHHLNLIWSEYTTNYLSIPVIMMAVGGFNLLINANLNKFLNWQNQIEWLASLSFGIYLIHGYFILFLRQYLGFKFDVMGMNVYLYNFLDVGLVLLLSALVVGLWRKLPKVKALIGG